VIEQEDPTTASDAIASELGVNAWLVEETYQEFLTNPSSVSESWRAYFAGGGLHSAAISIEDPVELASPPELARPPELANGAHANSVSNGAPPAVPLAAVSPPISVAVPETSPKQPVPSIVPEETVTPLRGAAARIVENMVASLSVPTATSVHPTPAKAIEVNRTIINDFLAKTNGKKISFTHLIAYALVKAVQLVPSMNATFVEDCDGKGTPGVIRHEHVGLGIAIDIERASGRSLLVPAIRVADDFDFAGFVNAYEDLVAKARSNKLTVEDFSGVTMTLTNPGTLGTTQSVPRLMRGQGAIIGVGALDFPVEYRATDPEILASMGVGKIVTLTSTYDHRIIQGAESGLFLKYVDEFLVGLRGFYEEVFSSLGVPFSPVHLTHDRGDVGSKDVGEVSSKKQLAVAALIEAYRMYGHRIAAINPIAFAESDVPVELDLATYGLSAWDLDRVFLSSDLGENATATLREIIGMLRSAYCGTLAIEYRHIQRADESRWLSRQMETPPAPLSELQQQYILDRLNEAEVFESFLHSRYVGQKRFGLEGAISAVPFIDSVLFSSIQSGAIEAVIGMSHRGRLNVLANIIGKPAHEIFSDFEQNLDPLSTDGSGDMKYHKGGSGLWTGLDGNAIPVSLIPNPSHLEAVNSVVEGVVRAKRDRQDQDKLNDVVALLLHGDASFAGQGVVAESLNLSRLAAYSVGGTIHLVINNQIGFTTPPTSARSTTYATDIAKSIEAPILHVNADDPEAVVRAAKICVAYRHAFSRDVVVDLVCYRMHGHNEGDDPSYTQPLMYRVIAEHQSVNAQYAELLIERGVVSSEEVQAGIARITKHLAEALDQTRTIPVPHFERLPERVEINRTYLPKDTSVDQYVLSAMSEQIAKRPDGFHVHPKLGRQFDQRDELLSSGEVDWATGEALAFGSIMIEGRDIRLIGQDARRGTFSHRHAVLVDFENGTDYVPLSSLSQLWSGLGSFEVYDSLLSEFAALGFEYGYSVESPNTLVVWEAQFGDFANGAQIVIDNFIVAGEEKWGQISGLVMLLPHGYEGQGPEHSSARIERFLAASANANMTIAQPTTTAQYFHLLRAHVHNLARRPLIVMSPKYLLRARPARSRMSELSSGFFREILDDPSVSFQESSNIDRIVLCTGKIAFEALERRDTRRAANLGGPHSAVVRIEQLYPWPGAEIDAVLARYSNASEVVWLQDEPTNMGAWGFVLERLLGHVSDRRKVRHVSRAAAASPATGSHILHDLEIMHLLDEAIGAAPDA